MSEHRHLHVHKSKTEIFINNFLGGMAWGLGASVGVSLLFALLGLIAAQVGVVPFVGSFVSDVLDFVLRNNQYLQTPPR